MTRTVVLPTEADFTSNVLQLARLLSWRSAHFRPARTAQGWRTPVQGDGKGFPDLVLLRGPRLVVAELKRRPADKPDVDQVTWLDAFRAVGAEVFVWRPTDLDEIVEVLR